MDAVRTAETDAEIQRCFPVLRQLHSHAIESSFVADVRRFQSSGYRLVYLESAGAIACVAGFRFGESFGWGRFLYVHEIVTDGPCRSQGHGTRLMAWLLEQAREQGCDTLQLDSHVTRHASHRFYFNHGLIVNAHHFRIELRG